MNMPIDSLFQTYPISPELTLKNRIVMAPMTRNMADDEFVPTALMVDYYKRRSDAGLIVTEGTVIRPDGRGYSNTPGIFTEKQINGWQKVTAAVHDQDGRIFLQIWHVGRASHPHFLNGELPLAPSVTMMSGRISRTQDLHYGQSRAASTEDIAGLIDSYALAAVNAMQAGFDGVEIHGANGYLIDQFLHFHTNLRQDEYGETAENMARFVLAVVQACSNAIGSHKVAIRLSPGAYLNEIIGDARDGAVFQYLLTKLNDLAIAYVHTGSFDDKKSYAELNNKTMTAFIREYYHGTLMACGGYTVAEANAAIDQKQFDLIAFGRPFIANPDLINQLQGNQLLQTYHNSMLTSLI